MKIFSNSHVSGKGRRLGQSGAGGSYSHHLGSHVGTNSLSSNHQQRKRRRRQRKAAAAAVERSRLQITNESTNENLNMNKDSNHSKPQANTGNTACNGCITAGL